MEPALNDIACPVFPGGFPQRDFKLVENKTYSKGSIMLKYKRSRKQK